jgi:putative PEP-CTERM system TPR-repeat lipoprotein
MISITKFSIAMFFIFIISMDISYANTNTDELYEKALNAYNDEDYGTSIVLLKDIMSRNPEHLSGRILLGRSFLQSRQFRSAESQFRQAIIDGADKSQILIAFGQSLLFQGEYEALLDTIKLSPNSINKVDILAMRGRSYFELNRFSLAMDSYNKAISFQPSNTAGYLGNAIVELKLGNLTKGEAWLDKALDLDSENAEALQLKGDVLFRQGNMPLAKKYIERSVAIDENNFRARLLLAEIYIAETELDNAFEHVKFVLELEPDYPNANLLYAFILLKQDRKVDAQKVSKDLSSSLSKIDESDLNKYPVIRLILGTSLYIQESWENAYGHLHFYAEKYAGHEQSHIMTAELDIRFERYGSALNILNHYNGESKSSQYWLLTLIGLINQGDHVAALTIVENALKSYPEDVQLLSYKVKLLIANDDLSSALALLTDLYNKGQASDELTLLLGQLQLSVSELEQADKVAKNLLENQPDNPVYLSLSAGIDFKMGQHAVAENKLKKAIELAPKMLQLYINLHYVYLEQGKIDLASNLLNIANQKKPKDPFIILKLAELSERVYNFEVANKWRRELYKFAPEDLSNLINLADNLLKLKQGDVALDLLLPHRVYNRLNIQYLSRLAASYVSVEQCDDATRVLDILHGLSFENTDQLASIASMFIECGRYQKAHKSLEAAEKISSENHKTILVRAQWFIVVNQQNLALKLLQPLIVESNRKAIELQVKAYDSMNANEEAVSSAKVLYSKYPMPINAHRLFNALKKNKKDEEGIKVLENYLLDHENFNLRRIIAFEYLELEDLMKAEKSFTILAEKYQWSGGYRQLALIKKSQGKINEAVDYAKKSYQLDSNSPAVAATYGWLLVQSGQAGLGLPHLRFAHARDGRQPTLMFRLGETLLLLDQPQQAKSMFQQAIEYDFPEKQKASARLKEL